MYFSFSCCCVANRRMNRHTRARHMYIVQRLCNCFFFVNNSAGAYISIYCLRLVCWSSSTQQQVFGVGGNNHRFSFGLNDGRIGHSRIRKYCDSRRGLPRIVNTGSSGRRPPCCSRRHRPWRMRLSGRPWLRSRSRHRRLCRHPCPAAFELA